MKKFFFTAYVIAAIALVPAIVFGYLHQNAAPETQSTEMVNDVINSQESSSILGIVKSF
jgi:hypothetical protein